MIDFKVCRKEMEWGGRKLVLETGKIARQATGAVIVTYGETQVIATVCAAKEAKAAPIKEEIEMDTFDKVDMRVCKILKAEEIKKSHSCLKLTLDDGLGGRVIVSSIKNDYTTEELVGKKIIVIANLKPAKFSGVKSEGMLVAATHEECGCKVIFVDDSVPTGTAIH